MVSRAVEVEAVDHLLHVGLGLLPQGDALPVHHALALAGADFVPLQRHGPHALVERVALGERQGERQHRAGGGDGGEGRQHELAVEQPVEERLDDGHPRLLRSRS